MSIFTNTLFDIPLPEFFQVLGEEAEKAAKVVIDPIVQFVNTAGCGYIEILEIPHEGLWRNFFTSIVYNKNDELDDLLETEDPNTIGPNGLIPLHIAVMSDNRFAVQLLLGYQADIEAKHDKGETALHIAARMENDTMVKLLLTVGADVNAQDNFGDTALHKAAVNGDLNIIATLISHNAEIDKLNAKNQSPYFLACFNGNINEAQYLRDMGSDPQLSDNDGNTPDAIVGTSSPLAYLSYLTSAALRDRVLTIDYVSDQKNIE